MPLNLIHPARQLGHPSALLLSEPTAAERAAFATATIDVCLDAAAIAPEATGLALRERAGGAVAPVRDGTLSTLNSLPALTFANTGGITLVRQAAPSYFVAAAIELTATTDTTGIMVGTIGGAIDDQRLEFVIMSSRQLRLSHKDNGALQPGLSIALDTPSVVWASFDAETNTAQLGVNTLSPGASSVNTAITGGHSGQLSMDYFGEGNVTWGMEGQGAMLVRCDTHLQGAQNEARRAAVLGMLAERIGVTLTV